MTNRSQNSVCSTISNDCLCSVLRTDFNPESDIDVLVEFEPEHVPGLLGVARMERQLSELFDGRKVDLRTPEDLSRYFRDAVLQEADLQYAQR